MTHPINLAPKDLWVQEIFTLLDPKSLDNVAKTCKAFKAYAEDPRVLKIVHFESRHPFEAIARFYISNIDTRAILDKFHQLNPDDQNMIKLGVRRLIGNSADQDWVDNQFQSNIKHPTIFKAMIAFGKLGLRLSALQDFQKTVEDLSLPSECVTNALKKLSRVPWTNLNPNAPQFFGYKLPLTENNAAEAVKYFVWGHCGRPTHDLDFGFTFISEHPHADEVKDAISGAQSRALDRFEIYDEFEADQRLTSLVENYQLNHFIRLHEQSNDDNAILLQFGNLDPAYQKLIKIQIWETGGKQMLHLGDWAEQELKTNIRGDTIRLVKEQFKNLPFKLTPETALCFLAVRALKEFEEIINDTSKSPDDVMLALQRLEDETYSSGWTVAEAFKYFILCNSQPDAPDCSSETRKQLAMQQASDFIKANPHHQIFNECIGGMNSHLKKTMMNP